MNMSKKKVKVTQDRITSSVSLCVLAVIHERLQIPIQILQPFMSFYCIDNTTVFVFRGRKKHDER